MLWLFQRIMDRAYSRLTLLVARQFEAEAELELSTIRNDLLRRALELESSELPGSDVLADDLRKAAQRAGTPGLDAQDVLLSVQIMQDENLRDPKHLRIAPATTDRNEQALLPGTASGKRRGRPRKQS